MQFQPYERIVPGARYAALCIHGIVGTPMHFRDLLPLIPEDWSICNMLLDGHGGQVEDFSRTSMKKWKTQVSAQLDRLLLTHEQVLIVAHSMGTLFAMDESIRRPERIRGLFLLDVPLTPRVTPGAAVSSLRLAFGQAKPNTPAGDMQNASGVHLTPKLWKYLSWLPRFWELLAEAHRSKVKLSQIFVPCLAFQSRQDELVSRRAYRILLEHPHIQVSELPNSGHFSYKGADLELLQIKLSRLIQELSP